jgi:hypothetical protein
LRHLTETLAAASGDITQPHPCGVEADLDILILQAVEDRFDGVIEPLLRRLQGRVDQRRDAAGHRSKIA